MSCKGSDCSNCTTQQCAYLLICLLPCVSGHEENKPQKSIVGDLCRAEEVKEAVKGVDAVIHTAGVISFGVFPNYEAMEAVNVKGQS